MFNIHCFVGQRLNLLKHRDGFWLCFIHNYRLRLINESTICRADANSSETWTRHTAFNRHSWAASEVIKRRSCYSCVSSLKYYYTLWLINELAGMSNRRETLEYADTDWAWQKYDRIHSIWTQDTAFNVHSWDTSKLTKLRNHFWLCVISNTIILWDSSPKDWYFNPMCG